jgi:hypothetical protein
LCAVFAVFAACADGDVFPQIHYSGMLVGTRVLNCSIIFLENRDIFPLND